MRISIFLALIFIGAFSVRAQKSFVEGTVTDARNGQPLTGVSVIVKPTNQGTSTGVDGKFQLPINDAKKISLVFSYNGVTQQVDDIVIEEGKITTQDVSFLQREKTEEEVVVRAVSTSTKESAASLISFQKNTNTVASVISAESIKRSPDKNTGEILKRTPGASIQEGKFIIIRGLADRYNQATLNGILLTSTEPDRKSFSFDLIPAQMIDNIIINKAFVPEYPGEWAGGLIQVSTKDIPSKNFLNIQVGTGVNTNSTGKNFLKDADGGKLDWLGIDDGKRALPKLYSTKSNFDTANHATKILIGKNLRNAWSPTTITASPNISMQMNGGFVGKLFNKKVGGTFGWSYSKSNKTFALVNRLNKLIDNTEDFTRETDFDDTKYTEEITVGALASLSLQFNALNKISIKSIINVNNTNALTNRNGIDISREDKYLKGYEFTFKQNTFFTTQINGEHSVYKNLKLKWYGAFNILDGYIPDQRRILYSSTDQAKPYAAVIANSLSQQSGSRIYQNLSDYIYTTGADVLYQFKAFNFSQSVKLGYMLQIKDRLFDAQLFANYLPFDNPSLRALSPDKIFASENFGNGVNNGFAFDAIKNRNFRYMANTILNSGFVQFDQQFSKVLRLVWGLRIENYDQLVGSVKTYDPRHTYSKVTDFLPGLNLTYKLNSKTNLRLSGSQTVIRPELRELSSMNLYDFELNASVQGKPTLLRTKVYNADLRYEIYPRAGEVFTTGIFYKKFKDPIEQIFNEGSGGASTFTFQNPAEAYSYGVEMEVRKKLDIVAALKNFSFQANAALIKSNIKDSTLKIDRPLQGQSPYLVNLGLLYDIEKLGLNATLLFNIIGERIYLVGDKSAGAGSPDIYEAPRPLLDFQVSKKLLKNKADIKITASDLLNKTQYFYQNASATKNLDFQKNKDSYRFTRNAGTTYNLTFNYSL